MQKCHLLDGKNTIDVMSTVYCKKIIGCCNVFLGVANYDIPGGDLFIAIFNKENRE